MAFLHVDLPEDTPDRMAQGLVEKFMRAGAPDDQVMLVFRNPLSGGPHQLYYARGETWVRELVTRVRKTLGDNGVTGKAMARVAQGGSS